MSAELRRLCAARERWCAKQRIRDISSVVPTRARGMAIAAVGTAARDEVAYCAGVRFRDPGEPDAVEDIGGPVGM